MNLAYRVALICGALPLLVGVAIFALYLCVGLWSGLVVAGCLTLMVGVALFVVGVFWLDRFNSLAAVTPGVSRRRVRFATFGCVVLLLANFPVAFAITLTVFRDAITYTVVIRNASQEPLSDVRVSGGGCEADFGTIPPGTSVRRSMWTQGDGELELYAVDRGSSFKRTIDTYVTNGGGGFTTVTISTDGTISVTGTGAHGIP